MNYKNFIIKSLLFVSIFFNGSCLKETFLDIVGVDWKPKCNTGKVYEKEFTTASTFVSPNFETFNITADFENSYVAFIIPPKEIGRIAYTISEVHKSMNFPNNNSTRKQLSSGHFIIVGRDDIFADLLNDEEKASMVSAFIHTKTKYVCWEVPENANWTSVIREQFWNLENSWIIMHEMFHILAKETYGFSDPEHSILEIWDHTNENSLFFNVIKEYNVILENEYGTSVITP
jgi:hypothetical protein